MSLAARLFVEQPLAAFAPDEDFALPPGAARHVQVLRLQPGGEVLLFDGSGDEWTAAVTAMGRSEVRVVLRQRHSIDRELHPSVTLAVVMPANDRMDGIVEKACELGAWGIQPLMSERSVLRLTGERAQKKQAHWQGVAIAAAEQCGRTRPLQVAPVLTLSAWLAGLSARGESALERRWLLSPVAAEPLRVRSRDGQGPIVVLSGPEGGLSAEEEEAARRHGFQAVQLGPRILRADTAPLAVLGWIALGGIEAAATAS
ncbi:16S rRNA (uracil1498-N3)-methyltransferase [Roseateles depolymerans]|uniref:Ribosomal RNA small subunit methyltransferase E n=1 Tax=Roseateles depolymerans TaxID=76731 RepID=A0A0U3LLU2_9BURK|nr:Ribosomal RNA small subunit methyltransferase E [Roseateles depolymerans]REG13842.1 16S rRNA (uracil1498-N3)-methyltransferase [Roseateles depolymerans]